MLRRALSDEGSARERYSVFVRFSQLQRVQRELASALYQPDCENQSGVCVGAKKPDTLCSGGAWSACEDAQPRSVSPLWSLAQLGHA